MSVTLKIPQGEYSGWKTIRINRSIEQASGEFTLEVTEKLKTNLKQHEIQPDQRCTVLANGLTVINGYVDLVEPSYDATTHSISVSGRDVTADIIDSSAVLEKGELANVTILQLAQALLKDKGITIDCPAPGKPFEKAVVNGGETVFEVLKTHAAQRGMLVYTLGDGVLHIGNPAQTNAKIVLEEGKNIKVARSSHDVTQLYHTYIFHAQGKNGKTTTHTVTDPTVRKSRTLVIDVELAEGSSLDLKTRADWELKSRKAKAKRASVTVQGWEYAPKKLWNVALLVHLKSPRLGYDTPMLISTLNLSVDDSSGTLAELTLTDPAAYAPQPT
jgi:prophage tail gpP-like protein